ncbi:MAG TPA: CDC48 family AAA ATPase [Ktedonobacterales bacterium]|nr:CDC48 family AAA ATPase [Ktedonobacterales bacterium]
MSTTERDIAATTDSLLLTVVEGLTIPRGTACVGAAALAALGAQPGDVIEIAAERVTVAQVDRWSNDPAAGPGGGEQTIAMDGLVRHNAGAALGAEVRVRHVAAPPAISAALVPAGGGPANLNEAELRHIARSLRGLAVVAGDLVRVPGLGLTSREFQVLATNPASAVILEAGTSLRIQPHGAANAPRATTVTYEDIGGLGRELQHVRELIELPLKHPELFDRLGIEAPKGVLLYGPPGTGKTLIARAVAAESSAHFFSLSGPEIIDKFYGESEAHLRRVFADATKSAPSVIFLDEIDAIAPKRSEVWGEVEKRVVGQLLTLMDGLRARGQVIVVGATNRPDALDPALRRPGRFDREISLHAPDVGGRVEILRIHSRDMPLAADVDLAELARITPGFVGADLAALCREAAMAALRRTFPRAALTNASIPAEELLALTVTLDDFQEALKGIEPSAAREVAVELGRTAWDEVGGLEDAKRALTELIEWPLRYPELYTAMDLDPVRGVLLAGPPGTGKTLIARALATACQANFITVKGPELLSKWVGESERGVRETFQRAKQVAPCVLFLDEFDALAPRRGHAFDGVADRVIGQLLTELDGIEGRRGVIVVAATNRPELLDPAILRPGRIDLTIELPLPDKDARRAIFAIHTKRRALARGVTLDALARKTNGMSGADIEAVCRRAANRALAEWLRTRGSAASRREPTLPQGTTLQIEMRHFEAAIGETQQRSTATRGLM